MRAEEAAKADERNRKRKEKREKEKENKAQVVFTIHMYIIAITDIYIYK